MSACDANVGADNNTVHRVPRPHLFVLLRLSSREGHAGRLRANGLQKLRRRSMVGSGKRRCCSL